MKFTKIQSSKTNETIMYFVDNIRVSYFEYINRFNNFLYWHKGNYNISYIEKTRGGNYKHVSHLSH
jgi:hypothetical protein